MEIDFSPSIPQQGSRLAAPDGCIAIFEMRPKEDSAATKREGRPMFVEVPYVTIMVPGDRDKIERRVREEDKQRFAEQWAQFEATRLSTGTSGTPLDQWPALSVTQRAELVALNIPNVESLAMISDGNLEKLGPGARELRDKAQNFLDFAKDAANPDGVIAQRDAAQERIRELEATLAEAVEVNQAIADERDTARMRLATLLEEHDALKLELEEARRPKRRGRPPKNPNTEQSTEEVDAEGHDNA